MTVSLGRGVSVYEMLSVIARAKVATKSGTAEEITAHLRSLDNEALVNEYHWAISVLLGRGLLSREEQIEAAEYARDWMDSRHSMSV